MSSPKSPDKTPFEIVYKSKPNVKHMRIFGCKAYVLTPKEKRIKWDPKAREGIFMGCEERSKAYRVYDIEAGQVVISRDVTFDESSFDDSKADAGEEVNRFTDVFDDMQVSDDSVTRVFTQAGKRKSRLDNQDRGNVRLVLDSKKQARLDRRLIKTNVNLQRRKKKNPKKMMKTARLHPCSGVQVRMLWKQVTARSRRRFKKL
ncbi:Integrase catalytic core protein [Phytophthora cinnamomi]|uniref:Integrase catalytic core protein n=1 Tax=Phytophthora cinnamomi TaxID=4785 RepID=UPI00355A7241|nr:Integrase catalytic core protein [Phytophthora cinnamomi]